MTNEKNIPLKVSDQDMKELREGIVDFERRNEVYEIRAPELVPAERYNDRMEAVLGAAPAESMQRPKFFLDEPSIGFAEPISPNSIRFNNSSGDEPVLRLEDNGDIFVHGRLAENDKEVVQGMRDFLKGVR